MSKQQYKCKKCSKLFDSYRESFFCSRICFKLYNNIEGPCSFCNKVFNISKSRFGKSIYFCSKKCNESYKRHKLICEVCNIQYFVYRSALKNSKYCSVECKTKNQTKSEMIETFCLECSALILDREHKNRRFCNKKCKNKYNNTCIKCKFCKKSFIIYNCFINNRKFCSLECSQYVVVGGRCKWFEHVKVDGTTIKVQGTWELAFVKWLDEQKLSYDSHRGRIPYLDKEGNNRNYYPDFYIYDWDKYIDIKNEYHMNLHQNKFDSIFKSNPDKNIKILLKEDLIELGVNVPSPYESSKINKGRAVSIEE